MYYSLRYWHDILSRPDIDINTFKNYTREAIFTNKDKLHYVEAMISNYKVIKWFIAEFVNLKLLQRPRIIMQPLPIYFVAVSTSEIVLWYKSALLWIHAMYHSTTTKNFGIINTSCEDLAFIPLPSVYWELLLTLGFTYIPNTLNTEAGNIM